MSGRFVFRFTQAWWARNHQFTFGSRYYLDPVYRTELSLRMEETLRRELPDVPVRCFTQVPGAIGLGLVPTNVFLGVCGARIVFPENEDPWAVTPLLPSAEAMRDFRAPDLASSAFVMQLVEQFQTLLLRFPAASIDAFGTGATAVLHTSLVNGYKLVGDAFFPLMYEQPTLVHDFLARLTEMNQRLVDFFADLRGATIEDLNLSDCVASLLSPRLYDEFGVPYNAQLVARYHASYGVHSCGPSTHIVASLVRTPGARWCEVGWSAVTGHTDLSTTRRVLESAGCPELKVLLTPGEVLLWSEEDIRQSIMELKAAAGPGELVVRAILEDGVSLAKVRVLYQAVESA